MAVMKMYVHPYFIAALSLDVKMRSDLQQQLSSSAMPELKAD